MKNKDGTIKVINYYAGKLKGIVKIYGNTACGIRRCRSIWMLMLRSILRFLRQQCLITVWNLEKRLGVWRIWFQRVAIFSCFTKKAYRNCRGAYQLWLGCVQKNLPEREQSLPPTLWAKYPVFVGICWLGCFFPYIKKGALLYESLYKWFIKFISSHREVFQNSQVPLQHARPRH